jgi:hypothetical protein
VLKRDINRCNKIHIWLTARPPSGSTVRSEGFLYLLLARDSHLSQAPPCHTKRAYHCYRYGTRAPRFKTWRETDIGQNSMLMISDGWTLKHLIWKKGWQKLQSQKDWELYSKAATKNRTRHLSKFKNWREWLSNSVTQQGSHSHVWLDVSTKLSKWPKIWKRFATSIYDHYATLQTTPLHIWR